jgi:hypothetical protein
MTAATGVRCVVYRFLTKIADFWCSEKIPKQTPTVPANCPSAGTSFGESTPLGTDSKGRKSYLSVGFHQAGGADEEGLTVPWGNLRVEVVDDDIVVTQPGSNFSVVYYKPRDEPQLVVKGTPSGNYKFLARAWQAANDKARELGWIV